MKNIPLIIIVLCGFACNMAAVKQAADAGHKITACAGMAFAVVAAFVLILVTCCKQIKM
jgi:hypothetical protein